MKPELKVTCAILEHNGRVLVTQRSELMKQPLLWEFPGGKVEDDETEEASLVREIKEELQLDVTPLLRLNPVTHDYSNSRILLIPYICRLNMGRIKLTEHAAYEWAETQALRNYNWCPADIPVVEEYLQLKATFLKV